MSIVTRPKRLSEAFASPSSSEAQVPAFPAARHEAEAPEEADNRHEAPESRAGRLAEAPDAGEGRGSHLEHEFTHGRSQS